MAQNSAICVDKTITNNIIGAPCSLPFNHNKRFASQKRRSRKGIFTTNTLPHRFNRDVPNNCSTRQQADVIRYISNKDAADSSSNNALTELQPQIYFHNVFSPAVHSTPIYKHKQNSHSLPKNSTTSFSVNGKQSQLPPIISNSNVYLDDYDLFKSSRKSNVPTISKMVDIEMNPASQFNVGVSGTDKESKIIKRRGIRGVSWILSLALKDTSVGKIYRMQIGWIILILIVFTLVGGLLVHFSGNFSSYHLITFTNFSRIPNFAKRNNSLADSTIEITTSDSSYYDNIDRTILLRNLLSQNNISNEYQTTAKFVKTILINETVLSDEHYKTEDLITEKINRINSSKLEEYSNQLIDYCRGCRKNLDVCLAEPENGIPVCRTAVDAADPTGCGGLCALEVEACHLLNKKHSIYTCQPLEVFQLCSVDEWTCRNHLCVPKTKRCDGHINCYDRSDEDECSCDLSHNFRCGNKTSCLEKSKKCNGIIDCWDGSDEVNCTTECPGEQFTCNNGECIDRFLFCDGLPDCSDESDEPTGCGGNCRNHEFKCTNNRCISKWRLCDGTDNCGDASDESACPHTSEQPQTIVFHNAN